MAKRPVRHAISYFLAFAVMTLSIWQGGVLFKAIGNIKAMDGGNVTISMPYDGALPVETSISVKIHSMNPDNTVTFNTTIPLENDYNDENSNGIKNIHTINNLPEGEYKVSVILPMGVTLEQMVINGVSDSSMERPLTIGGQETDHDIKIFVKQEGTLGFSSTDLARNTFNASPAYTGMLNAYLKGPPNPIDLMLVLDMSKSMAFDLQGNFIEGYGSGVSYNYDAAKYDEQSRYTAMRKSVDHMLRMLSEDRNVEVSMSIVLFSDDATDVLKEATDVFGQEYGDSFILFSASDFTEEDPEDLSSDDILEMIDDYELGGNTSADLALARAREIFEEKTISAAEERDRYLLFFTDGVPGNETFDEITQSTETQMQFARYNSNPFRVIAETLNQGTLLKGKLGVEVVANHSIEGMAPLSGGIPTDNGQFQYYGVSPYRGSVIQPEEYNALWADTTKWNRGSTNLNAVDYPTPATYATPELGNFKRTGIGQGVEIYAVGIFDDQTFPTEETEKYVQDFMTELSDGDFYDIEHEDELIEAFEEITKEVLKHIENVTVQLRIKNLDGLKAVNVSGGTVTEERINNDVYTVIVWTGLTLRFDLLEKTIIFYDLKSGRNMQEEFYESLECIARFDDGGELPQEPETILEFTINRQRL